MPAGRNLPPHSLRGLRNLHPERDLSAFGAPLQCVSVLNGQVWQENTSTVALGSRIHISSWRGERMQFGAHGRVEDRSQQALESLSALRLRLRFLAATLRCAGPAARGRVFHSFHGPEGPFFHRAQPGRLCHTGMATQASTPPREARVGRPRGLRREEGDFSRISFHGPKGPFFHRARCAFDWIQPLLYAALL